MSEYTRLEERIDSDPDGVFKRCVELLDENPDDAMALFLAATIYTRAEKFGFAIALLRRIAELKPDRAEPLNNLGTCYSGLGDIESAQHWYFKAWGKKPAAIYGANVAYTYMEQRKYGKALEWVDRALAIDPACVSAISTRGFCRLALGEWADGWKDWGVTVGGKFRKKMQFKDEQQWTGGRVGTLAVYGEQGLGDEIMFASCLGDAARDNDIVLECDSRLEGLFRRSFPFAKVYGTRRQKEIAWPNQHDIKANLPIGQLPEFYRPTPDSCPGKPYIQADPERRIQWRALFDTMPGMKIGIAWSGGSKHNNPKGRSIGLESFRGLIEGGGNTFVSLQYKDPTAEIAASGLPVRHFKRANETQDYDDFAAMVAELDGVIGVHTSSHHLAGAMGVPGLIIVPKKTLWTYNLDTMHWYSSASLFKQLPGEDWAQSMKRMSKDDSYFRWLRQARERGLSRVLPVDHQSRVTASCNHAAVAEVA